MSRSSLSQSQGAISDTNRSTIISVVPFSIDESKPGLIPGDFHIEPSLDGRPVVKVIGDSFFYVYIDADRGNLRVPAPSDRVAKSICDDYNSAQLEAHEDCHPGLFWKPGIWTPERVIKEIPNDLAYFTSVQNTWFSELVKRADDDWEKTRQHYAISDIQRYAAKSIDPENRQNRPWILYNKDMGGLSTQLCPACASEIPGTAIICKFCRAVLDEKEYANMTFEASRGLDLAKIVRQ